MLSAVGDDNLGAEALTQVRQWGVSTEYIAVLPEKQTGCCLVTLDERLVPSYNLLQDVAEDDAVPLREATGKANLIRLAEQNESVTVPFHRLKNGVPTPYTLQTIRTRESDRHHIVIGVKQG